MRRGESSWRKRMNDVPYSISGHSSDNGGRPIDASTSTEATERTSPRCTNVGFVNSSMSTAPWIACKGAFTHDPPHNKPFMAASAMGS
ncbi:hypothetical protein TNCV_4870361 [Trichonephila clavipes]|nr:hypothetical protein TNCV_4870361 [Trichonephila clavipes]